MSKAKDLLRKEFMQVVLQEWNTPDTYDATYKAPPKAAGIYCIIVTFEPDYFSHIELLYIGCSANLSRRESNHEVIRNIKASYPSAHMQFYFKEIKKDFEQVEQALITEYQPLLNRVRKFKI